MEVELSTLESAFRRTVQYLHDTGKTSIEIDEDYYWHIPEEHRYNPYKEPGSFTLGQLSDDLQEICKIAKCDSEPVGMALCWLAALLRIYGEKAGV